MASIETLIAISSPSLVESKRLSTLVTSSDGIVFCELASLLIERNGFTAFESALIVFPAVDTPDIPALDSWNQPEGWRRYYDDCISDDVVFFAEDVFGGQFGASSRSIVRFDPESGTTTKYADSLHEWASNLLKNYKEDTGWPLAHDWQMVNGPLPRGHLLLPKVPFILGGDYEVGNLLPVDGKAAMEKWGQFYRAIKDVPDGVQVAISDWIQ